MYPLVFEKGSFFNVFIIIFVQDCPSFLISSDWIKKYNVKLIMMKLFYGFLLFLMEVSRRNCVRGRTLYYGIHKKLLAVGWSKRFMVLYDTARGTS